ncbi:uncharacterized protein MCYG_02494 [Microsporum canis CBS 113480]|uniref:Uncharacterized protein n=1 Tax=Arthroderma otae (strain ATCC MYA-4605 / CBS 113480) TaxID=554155 RepID=C5FFZ0_ARTOC|nr:uncharacterized protein MCYG_02494 [Microsporum canis CBS 113480]EEQ29675.1 predicted protein [Microsporum canis CBS 113480]
MYGAVFRPNPEERRAFRRCGGLSLENILKGAQTDDISERQFEENAAGSRRRGKPSDASDLGKRRPTGDDLEIVHQTSGWYIRRRVRAMVAKGSMSTRFTGQRCSFVD